MAKGRSYAMMYGKIMLGEPMVFYVGQHGIFTARRLAKKHKVHYSKKLYDVNYAFGVFGRIWSAVPTKMSALWESIASMLGDAKEVESASSTHIRGMPIPNYPRRPKLMTGKNYFLGANVSMAIRKMATPRFIPPDVPEYVPPSPALSFEGYDRKSGVLALGIGIPDLIKFDDIQEKKVTIWLNLYSDGKTLREYLVATIDITVKPGQKMIYKFDGLDTTRKSFGYGPIKFKDLPYFHIDMAGEIIIARRPEFCAVISSHSNILNAVLLNDPDYIKVNKMIEEGRQIPLDLLELGHNYKEIKNKLKKGFFIREEK